MGRIYSVIAGVGAIILVYLFAMRLFDAKTGILAAALTSFSLYHVQASAWATVDTMSSLFMIAFIFVAYLAIYDFKNLVSFTGAGIVFGLLLGTRYTGGVAAIVFLVFYIDSIVQNSQGDRAFVIVKKVVLDHRFWIFGLAAIVTFLLTTPGLLIFPDALTHSIAFEKIDYHRITFHSQTSKLGRI